MASNIEIKITAENLAGKALEGVTNDLKGLEKQATTSGGGISKALGGISWGKVGAGAAIASVPIIALGKSAIDAASDMAESSSKAQVVFGDWADEIDKFTSSASTSLGLSKQAATEAAGTYGNLFTAMGMGQDKAAGMSMGLIQLAADLGSFNNMDPTLVLDKLRAGLTGETEPLKTLGVNLNAAAVAAKAMEMGLADSKETMTASAKAQATYALIMEQTKTAQGDFARTSDGLANSQRIAAAQMADLSAELGVVLLPFMTQAVSTVRDVVQGFQNMSPELKTAAVAAGGLIVAIGPIIGIVSGVSTVVGILVPGLGALAAVITGTVLPAIGGIVLALGPVLLIIGAVALVVGALYLAYQSNFLGIRDIVDNAVGAIKQFLGEAIAFIGGLPDKIASGVQGAIRWFENLKTGVSDAVSGMVNGVLGFFSNLSSGISGRLEGFVSGVRGAVNSVIGFINSLIGSWNNLSFRIPGFSITLPHVDLPPPIGRVGGGQLGWSGVTVSTPNLPRIPVLDAGGIVTSPTLALLAANNRPEAVIPLSRAGTTGRAVNLTVVVQGNTLLSQDRSTAERLAEILIPAINSRVRFGI